jgi:hypothetical protein
MVLVIFPLLDLKLLLLKNSYFVRGGLKDMT